MLGDCEVSRVDCCVLFSTEAGRQAHRLEHDNEAPLSNHYFAPELINSTLGRRTLFVTFIISVSIPCWQGKQDGIYWKHYFDQEIIKNKEIWKIMVAFTDVCIYLGGRNQWGFYERISSFTNFPGLTVYFYVSSFVWSLSVANKSMELYSSLVTITPPEFITHCI